MSKRITKLGAWLFALRDSRRGRIVPIDRDDLLEVIEYLRRHENGIYDMGLRLEAKKIQRVRQKLIDSVMGREV